MRFERNNYFEESCEMKRVDFRYEHQYPNVWLGFKVREEIRGEKF